MLLVVEGRLILGLNDGICGMVVCSFFFGDVGLGGSGGNREG